MLMRSESVILRKEAFGGLAFHIKRGITIEMDNEGFYLLKTLSKPDDIGGLIQKMSEKFHKKFPEKEVKKFVRDLIELGFVSSGSINPDDEPEVRKSYNDSYTIKLKPAVGFLSAPETVHLTLTGKCNLSCPFCYEMERTKKGKEMTKEEIFGLIDELAEMKVFQLAIGGGEPFLRNDIFEIIKYCQKKNIVPNITTNGTIINLSTVRKIKGKVGGISVSLNGYSLETNAGRDPISFYNAVRGIKLLIEGGVATGINLLVSRDNLRYLDDTLNFMKRLGVKWVNVLRIKTEQNSDQLLSGEDMINLKGVLDRWNGLLNINIDSALTCLMYTIPVRTLREKAVYGCTAGIRFCTIDYNGDVYPCSFFKYPEYLAGNILENSFREIWLNSGVFTKFRGMRENLKNVCKDCRIKEYCGGCRSIAYKKKKDFFGEDGACIMGVEYEDSECQKRF